MTRQSHGAGHEPPRITSITSAVPGWVAIYQDGQSAEEFVVPVAVWAVTEDSTGHTFVSGVDMSGTGALGRPCDEDGLLLRYAYRPEPPTSG